MLDLIFWQVVGDVYTGNCIRLAEEESQQLQKQLKLEGIHSYNPATYSPKSTFKRAIIEMARELPNYFSRLYVVSGGKSVSNIDYLGVSHTGVNLLKRDKTVKHDCLTVIEKLRYVPDDHCLCKQALGHLAIDHQAMITNFNLYVHSYDEISEILIPSNCTLQILFNGGEWITLFSNKVRPISN